MITSKTNLNAFNKQVTYSENKISYWMSEYFNNLMAFDLYH